MPTNLIEWTVRTVMLALAGLVTLSTLGSIAAMSNEAGPAAGGFVVRPGTPPPPAPQTRTDSAADPGEAQPEPGNGVSDAVLPGASRAGEGAAPRPAEPSQRWLEAIAYALLALAGLLALAIVLLWRGLHHVRRLADAAEGRPRNE